MTVTHHIGLEIGRNELRLAEIRSADGFSTILRTDRLPTGIDYSSGTLHTLPYDADTAKAFIHDVASLVHRRQLFATRMTIVLPTSAAIIATVPIDGSLTPQQKREQADWECRVLSGAAEDSRFRTLAQLLRRDGTTEWYTVAGVPDATAAFLTATFAHLTFDVHGIEIRHFLLENSIRLLHPDVTTSRFAVCGIESAACIAGVYDRQRYVGVRIRRLGSDEHTVAEVLRAVHDVMRPEPDLVLDAVYVYGEDLPDAFIPALGASLPIPVSAFDAGSYYPYQSEADAAEAGRHPAHTYTAALCAAVRGAACA